VDNFTTKTDGISTQPAAEMNSLFTEAKNAVTTAGQTLAVDNLQLSRSMAIYASGADFYTDSGTTNTYTLSPVGTKRTPSAYFNGMRIRFYAGNSNTGASTVNVNSIGSVALKKYNASEALVGGEVLEDTFVEAVYNSTASAFDLLPSPYKVLTEMTMSTTQSITGGNVDVKLNFNTVATDRYSQADTTNKRIILKKVGQWRVSGLLYVPSGGQANEAFMTAYLNGSPYRRLNEQSLNNGNVTLAGDTILINTAIGDFVELFCNNNNTNPVTVGAISDFSVEFLSD